MTVPNARTIKAARIQLGWTQEELAERASLPRNSISRLESGGNSTMRTIKQVVKTLEEKGVCFLPETKTFEEGFRVRKSKATTLRILERRPTTKAPTGK